MRFLLFTGLVVFLIPLNSAGQKENLNDLNNRLLCNAYVYGKTDSITYKFLQQNFPYLTKETPKEGWSSPPIGLDAKQTVTSLKFKVHPFFPYHIKEGRLDFKTIEYPDGRKSEDGAQLWLFFEKKEDANAAFDELIRLYKNTTTSQDISEVNGQRTGRFVVKDSEEYVRKAAIVLSKKDDGYAINFKDWF